MSYIPSYASGPNTLPQFLPDFMVGWLPPFNFRHLVEMHHPVFPIFTLQNLPGIIYFVIGIAYNIALLLFAFLPIIFVVKKWKPVIWPKAFLAIFVTAFLFFYIVWGIDDTLGYFFDSYVSHSTYLSNYTNLVLIPVGPLLTLLLALSPFYWVKKIYPATVGQGSYTWGRFFLALFFSAVLLALAILFWYEIIIIGAAQAANFLNG